MRTVPFGKYQGQPIEVLLRDRDYCDWLSTQAWFIRKFGTINNMLIGNGTEISKTPQHNALQAKFVNDLFCWWFAYVTVPGYFQKKPTESSLLKNGQIPKESNGLPLNYCLKDFGTEITVRKEFEENGWDVILHITRTDYIKFTYTQITFRNVAIKEDDPDFDKKYARYAVQNYKMVSKNYDDTEIIACDTSTLTFKIELKPSMSDDFPAILRQVKYRMQRENQGGGYYGTVLLVAIDEFDAVGATFSEVRDMFVLSGIHIVNLRYITSKIEELYSVPVSINKREILPKFAPLR